MRTFTRWMAVLAVGLLLGSGAALGQEVIVVGFNTESGDADPDVVADVIEVLDGVDLWGFSEVRNNSWASIFTEAAAEGEGASFAMILGSTGGADRLLIVYNDDLLDLVRYFELEHINIGGHVRAPLVGEFTVTETGASFYFMVNHLYRSNEEARHQQAELLNDWADEQTLPVIAVGDYNFDWDVGDGENDHDAGYDNMVEDGVFAWIRPAVLVKTQCSPRFDSVLDFVFVSGNAQNWSGTSEILRREASYCNDTDETSDHRPVWASFNLGGQPESWKTQLLRRIEEIETTLEELRDAIEALDD